MGSDSWLRAAAWALVVTLALLLCFVWVVSETWRWLDRRREASQPLGLSRANAIVTGSDRAAVQDAAANSARPDSNPGPGLQEADSPPVEPSPDSDSEPDPQQRQPEQQSVQSAVDQETAELSGGEDMHTPEVKQKHPRRLNPSPQVVQTHKQGQAAAFPTAQNAAGSTASNSALSSGVSPANYSGTNVGQATADHSQEQQRRRRSQSQATDKPADKHPSLTRKDLIVPGSYREGEDSYMPRSQSWRKPETPSDEGQADRAASAAGHQPESKRRPSDPHRKPR